MESEYEKIGRRIHLLRAGRGILQGSLARRMGFSQTNMCNIEHGRTKATLKNIFKMQEIPGCTMRDFFEDAREEDHDMDKLLEAVHIMVKNKPGEAERE